MRMITCTMIEINSIEMKHWLNEGLEILRVLRKARKQSREKSNKKRRNHNNKPKK